MQIEGFRTVNAADELLPPKLITHVPPYLHSLPRLAWLDSRRFRTICHYQ